MGHKYRRKNQRRQQQREAKDQRRMATNRAVAKRNNHTQSQWVKMPGDQRWHHHVATVRPGGADYYVDGMRVRSGLPRTFTLPTEGTVSNVAYFDRALSREEVQQVYSASRDAEDDTDGIVLDMDSKAMARHLGKAAAYTIDKTTRDILLTGSSKQTVKDLYQNVQRLGAFEGDHAISATAHTRKHGKNYLRMYDPMASKKLALPA